jgi:hypothetical protein
MVMIPEGRRWIANVALRVEMRNKKKNLVQNPESNRTRYRMWIMLRSLSKGRVWLYRLESCGPI